LIKVFWFFFSKKNCFLLAWLVVSDMKQLLSIASVLALGACAYPNPQHVSAMNALVGKSETDVVKTLGVPSRTIETGGHKYLAYSRNKLVTIPGDYGFGPAWGWGYWGGGWGGGWGGWGGFPPEIVQRDCETTFDLLGGVVQSWTFRGNDC
jgi:hypothetical protein